MANMASYLFKSFSQRTYELQRRLFAAAVEASKADTKTSKSDTATPEPTAKRVRKVAAIVDDSNKTTFQRQLESWSIPMEAVKERAVAMLDVDCPEYSIAHGVVIHAPRAVLAPTAIKTHVRALSKRFNKRRILTLPFLSIVAGDAHVFIGLSGRNWHTVALSNLVGVPVTERMYPFRFNSAQVSATHSFNNIFAVDHFSGHTSQPGSSTATSACISTLGKIRDHLQLMQKQQAVASVADAAKAAVDPKVNPVADKKKKKDSKSSMASVSDGRSIYIHTDAIELIVLMPAGVAPVVKPVTSGSARRTQKLMNKVGTSEAVEKKQSTAKTQMVTLSSLIADLQTSYRATVHFVPPTDTSTIELAQAARPKISFGARTLVHEWSITAKKLARLAQTVPVADTSVEKL